MSWDEASIAQYVARHVEGLNVKGARELSGGLLNHVWRVEGKPYSVIVKHAPEHVATQPDVPLSSSRQGFEARALREFGPRLGFVHVPHVLHEDEAARLLVTEDFFGSRDLQEILTTCEADDLPRKEDGALIGEAIATLHRATFESGTLRERFDNADVQRVRAQVQYAQVGAWLQAAGVAQAEALGARVADLGARLCGPGVCMTMGDLWPRSILRDVYGEWCLIDWELAHFGHPVQDMAHLDAHLWIWAERAPTVEARASALAFRKGAREAYLAGAQSLLGALAPAGFFVDWGLHFAAELLARVFGPFAASGPYAACDLDGPEVAALIQAAVQAMHRGMLPLS